MLSRYVRNVLVMSDTAGISNHRLITAEVLLPLQIESSVRRITRRNFSKFDAMWFESTLLSSELYTSPETDVDNFVDQLECVANVCSSSYFHIRALHHIRPYLDSGTYIVVLLLVPGWTMPTQFSPAFLRAIFIAFSAFKIPWRVL